METLKTLILDLGLFILLIVLFIFTWLAAVYLLKYAMPIVALEPIFVQEVALVICCLCSYYFFRLYLKSLED